MFPNQLTYKPARGFIGRREELTRFESVLIDRMSARPSGMPFLHFCGTAGVGKTTLILQCREMCRSRSVPSAHLSFEEPRFQQHDSFDQVISALLADLIEDTNIQEFEQLLVERVKISERFLQQPVQARQEMD